MSDALGVRGTCLYPFSILSLVMNTAGPMLSMQSSMQGDRKESDRITALILWKSVQKWWVPLDFGASKHSELQGLQLGLVNPFSNR